MIVRILMGWLVAIMLGLPGTVAAASPPIARYQVRVLDRQPLRLEVTATLPGAGDRLLMSTTRPGGIALLDAQGWPGMVTGLAVADAAGRELATTRRDDGWQLQRHADGPLTLRYEVDYSLLSGLGWPAPRESAFVDEGNIVLAGRSLFIASPGQTGAHVTVRAPSGWHVAAPWPRARGTTGFRVESVDALVDNLFVLSSARPQRVAVPGLDIVVVAMGPWRGLHKEVAQVLGPVARTFAQAMPIASRQSYLVVLMPLRENGGESFRNSFAMNLADRPTRANRPRWGNTLAHELFHFWNGWRLQGADYAATQWFQEGFTEYAANKALLSSDVITHTQFMDKLAGHVGQARRLESTLAAPGTRKGPPLYSAGALVAFCWDVKLAQASRFRRSLDDVFAELWRATAHGMRPYAWPDLEAALQHVQPGDWEGFYTRHIAQREPLPVEAALQGLGLHLVGDGTDARPLQVVPDPNASAQVRAAWRRFAAP